MVGWGHTGGGGVVEQQGVFEAPCGGVRWAALGGGHRAGGGRV